MHKSTRLHLLIVGETLLLLAVTLGILAYFSHKALREEAMRNAELTLDGTVQNIDNILLSVEQATGRIYDDLLEHLDQPDRMYAYSRDLVESNPYINGCAICFKPGYYPGKDLFYGLCTPCDICQGNRFGSGDLRDIYQPPLYGAGMVCRTHEDRMDGVDGSIERSQHRMRAIGNLLPADHRQAQRACRRHRSRRVAPSVVGNHLGCQTF